MLRRAFGTRPMAETIIGLHILLVSHAVYPIIGCYMLNSFVFLWHFPQLSVVGFLSFIMNFL